MCVIPAFRRLKHKIRKLKVIILGYLASPRVAWNTKTLSKIQNKINSQVIIIVDIIIIRV